MDGKLLTENLRLKKLQSSKAKNRPPPGQQEKNDG